MDPADIYEFKVTRAVLRVVLKGVRDRPGSAADIFSGLSEKDIDYLLVSYDAATGGRGDIAFVVYQAQEDEVKAFCEALVEEGDITEYRVDERVALLRFKFAPEAKEREVVPLIFEILAQNGVNVEAIAYSKGVLALVVLERRLEDALLTFQEYGLEPWEGAL